MDEEIQLKKIEAANKNGDLTSETHLRLLDLVDDPEAEVTAAKEENDTKDAVMQAAIDEEMAAMNTGDSNPADETNPAIA